MEQLNRNKITTAKVFLLAGLLLMLTGMCWGITGALQYLVPGLLKNQLSFERVRPLHVSSVVFWIILAAMGSVLTYLQEHTRKVSRRQWLLKLQLFLFLTSVLAILASFVAGIFGGREYWEFHPYLALPVVAGWLLFLFHFLSSIRSLRRQPVYVWMWLTGIVFFLFTYLESYLWLFPYFRNNVVNDMTIQWKSYGSMVGSWNMLVYGCSIYLLDKISNHQKYSYSGIAFVLYFTSLFNLMFNWGHHIYTLPTHAYIKHISYAVSMTELFILGRIIYLWRSSLSHARKNFHSPAYRFVVAADVWVFLTLLLALAMSVPGINVYTHGTHITVAHTMGATIGINSFLLLAFCFDILNDTCRSFEPYKKLFSRSFWLVNVSLLVFWISLIGAGVLKAAWQMSPNQSPFSNMMQQLKPFFYVFFVAGVLLTAGMVAVVFPLLKNQLICYFSKPADNKKQFRDIGTHPLGLK